jgi:hypothetical protein
MSAWFHTFVGVLRRTAPVRVWWLVTGAYVVAWFASVLTKPLYAGDTRYYAATALRFAGYSRDAAYPLVVEYTARYHWATPPPNVLFDYGLTAPRVLLPLLSAPFVRLFGVGGLAVVPTLAFAGLMVALFVLTSDRFGWRAALVPLLLVAASNRVVYYAIAEITEGLTTLLAALILLVALRRDRLGPRTTTIWLVVLTTLMAFTRQATLVPTAAFALTWFALWVRRGQLRNRWALPALAVGATTLIVQVAQSLVWPGFSQLHQFEKATGTDSLLGALKATPRLAYHVIRGDLTFFARQDVALLLLIAGALVSALLLWRREESYLFWGGLAGSLVYNITNGVSSGFRYEMPALPFFVLSVAALVAVASTRRRRRPVATADRTEPVPTQPPRVASTTPTTRTANPSRLMGLCRSWKIAAEAR